MSRRTRQVALQFSSVKRWKTLKADVKAAFLQGNASEASHMLFSKPVPELAKAMGLQPNEMVQVMKSCYGLVNAPASWFKCVRDVLAEIGFTQSHTDPCLWFLVGLTANGEREVKGYICSHVDDFLISGDEDDDDWIEAVSKFYSKFSWSPWEFESYLHCGIHIREEPDHSYILDHSAFCEGIEPITYEPKEDHEPLTSSEMTQLRGALGALQWRAQQTAPYLMAKLGQLQSDIAVANVSTIKAVNKLIRECFQSRFLSVKKNQLDIDDPKKVVFAAWSDAALANRRDLSSTGGYVICASTPQILQGSSSKVSVMSWRSSKLARKARSSLAAETQALAEADQELMYVRLAWAELCGIEVTLRQYESAVSQICGIVVTDAKSLYDVLIKRDLNSSAVGMKDKHTALEMMCLLESIERMKTVVRWVHSHAQIADHLTKPLPAGSLHKVLSDGRWTLIFDPSFTSAKKIQAAKRNKYDQDFRGVSVEEPVEHQHECPFEHQHDC